MREKTLCCAIFNELSGIHDTDIMTHFSHNRYIMGDEQDADRKRVLQRFDFLQDLALYNDIQGRCRFIGDDEFGSAGQRHGNNGTLFHPTTVLVRKIPVPLGRDSDEPKEIFHLPFCRFPGQVRGMGQYRFGDLIINTVNRIQGVHGPLKDHRHFLPSDVAHLIFGVFQEIFSVKDNASLQNRSIGRQQSHQSHAQCRFTASGLSYEPEGLSLIQRKRDPFNRFQKPAPGLISDGQMVDFQ